MEAKKKYGYIQKLLGSLLLSVLVLLLIYPAGKLQAAEYTAPQGYEFMAENDAYALYLKAENLSVILLDKETLTTMCSTVENVDAEDRNNTTWMAFMQSGVVVGSIQGTTEDVQLDMINCTTQVQVEKKADGFTETIAFSDYGISFAVEVSLTENGIIVSIPEDSIKEEPVKKGANLVQNYIGNISLFPMFGATYLAQQEGYMIVPDGNGALIYLDDKEGRYANGYSQTVFGDDIGFKDNSSETLLAGKYDTVNDCENIIAPFFGMVHETDQLAYLGVITQGSERARIEVQPNGATINYNRCFAKFVLRRVYTQPLNNSNSGSTQMVESDRTHSDLSVRYFFANQEKANYSGLAVLYREYLLQNGMLEASDTSYKTRVDFLGTDRESFLLGTRAVVMTTVENVSEIFQELKDQGVESLLSVYKGWQKGGLYNLPITKYKAERRIGGTKQLTELIKDSAEDGYDVYLYNDALRINPDENNTTFNVVKRVNKRRFEETVYDNVYNTFLYLTPGKTTSNLTQFVKSYTADGVSNLALSGISDHIYSYNYSGDFYSRYDCAESYKNLIASVKENTNLILEQPYAYLWTQTDAFLDMPTGSSDFMYEDEEIPFLSIVLKGVMPMYAEYMNFQANKQEFFLSMIETGTYPSFYITYEDSSDLIYTNSADLYSTRYDVYKDSIISYDSVFRELSKHTENACIVQHEKPMEKVAKVTYDNGVVIYVNYNEEEVTLDGVTIGAMSYKVGEANE